MHNKLLLGFSPSLIFDNCWFGAQDLAGRTIRVDYATQRPPGERPGGSLPRGGGGYSPTGVHRENSTFGGSNDFGGGGSFGGNSDWRGM